MTDLTPLLEARSVAVIGASNREGNFGGDIIDNLVGAGFEGTIVAVHPSETSVRERPCVADVASLPDGIDCAIVALGAQHCERTVQAIADRGIPAAVVFADPNVGPGRDPGIEDRVAAIGHRAGLAMLGMNGMGFYSPHLGLAVSGYDVPSSLRPGGIALISHSGTVFDTLTQSPRLAFSYAVSGGNESVITETDYLEFVLSDPTTRLVALYLETVRRPARFLNVLAQAQERSIPIVALKVGTSGKGRDFAQAHTGARAGRPEAYAAVFRRFGVHQVADLEEMANTLELLSTVDPQPGGAVSVVMDSGGERSMFCDLAEDLGLDLAEFSDETNRALSEALEDGKEPANPLDPFGSAHLVTQVFTDTFRILDHDADVDVVVVCADFQREADYPLHYLDALDATRMSTPVVGMINLPEAASPTSIERMRSMGIPVLYGTRSGIAALRHLVAPTVPPWHPALVGRPPEPLINDWKRRIAGADGPLDELSAKRLLAAYGIRVPAGAKASSLQQATAIAAQLTFPVVVKTLAPEITDKSDVGGIIVGLNNEVALANAYRRMSEHGPDVLVERMTAFDHELLVGVTTDDQFGPLVVLGMGGIHTEILADTSTGLAPLSVHEAANMVRGLRAAPILQGTGGGPSADIETIVDVILRLATIAADFVDEIAEVKIDPLAVREDSATALDALVLPL